MALSVQGIALCFLLVLRIDSAIPFCDVFVPASSWPEPWLLVPPESTVEIRCALPNDSYPYWSVDVAGSGHQKQFTTGGKQIQTLNGYGFYELPPLNGGMLPTIRMLINDTTMINGTRIDCNGADVDGPELLLMLYERSSLMLEAVDGEIPQSVNISWTSTSHYQDVAQPNQLMVTSASTQELLIPLHDSHYQFTAPDNAPPCEVYNFSVTATPVGATYTGDGCSVPSSVLSRMLPSLPDISDLELSMNYSLMKDSGEVILFTSFQPAKYCVDYPVANYTIVVEGLVSAEWPETVNFTSTSAGNTLEAFDLLPDSIYTFKIVAKNSMGAVSTKGVEIYTTDVQGVTVVEVEGRQTTGKISCNFMTGSEALGCVVVLVGEMTNTTVILKREDANGGGVVITEVPYPLSCYYDVIAYDVEANGSNGTLPVLGTLVREMDTRIKCSQTKETPLQVRGESTTLTVGILISVITVLVIAITLAAIAVLIFRIKLRRSSNFSISPPNSLLDQKDEEGEPLPLYAEVKKVRKTIRSDGDGAELSDKVEQDTQATSDATHQVDCLHNSNGNQASIIDDSLIPDPDAPELPPPYNPALEDAHSSPIYDEITVKSSPKKSKETKTSQPLPVYQDILELSTRAGANDQVKLQECETVQQVTEHRHNVMGEDLPHLAEPLPVYQDIAELTSASGGTPVINQVSNGNLVCDSHTKCPVSTTSDLPPIHVYPSDQHELVSESSLTDVGEQQATNTCPHSRSHPTSLPINHHVAEAAADSIEGENVATSHYDTLSSALAQSSTASESQVSGSLLNTPEPLPTPIYEDIAEVVSMSRGETNANLIENEMQHVATCDETMSCDSAPKGTLV